MVDCHQWFDHSRPKSMASLNPDGILAFSSSSRACCVMKPHPSQSWEVRPQSFGWVRMGMLGDGTWYMVTWCMVYCWDSFSQMWFNQQHQELGMDMRGWLMITLTIGHLQHSAVAYDCVGDACVASAWGDFLAPCVFHFIILVLMEAFCERYDWCGMFDWGCVPFTLAFAKKKLTEGFPESCCFVAWMEVRRFLII